jgi:GTP-binding protein YchF
MKLGIIGLPLSGKATILEALTHYAADTGHKGEDRLQTVRVPEQRVEILRDMYKPRKTVFAQVEYFLPGRATQSAEISKTQNPLTRVRDCDALIHTVKNFNIYGGETPTAADDWRSLDQELILADMIVVEKRLERIEQEKKRNRKTEPQELKLLEECYQHLENERPLRQYPHLATAPLLKGFALLSAKPVLILFNNDDEDDSVPAIKELADSENCMAVQGKLEQELAQMSVEEAAEFMLEFNISASVTDRVIKKSYTLLGLISFFTVGEDEVRAWTIHSGTQAVNAAAAIHTDIQRGFIRAEVVAYTDLIAAGSYVEARKQGVVRLEGKTYEVNDGDIINFRFNV